MNKLISGIDKDEMKDILINIMNNIPLSEQERFYMISRNSLGKLGKKEETFRKKFEEVKKDFDNLTCDNIYVKQKNYNNDFYDELLYELPDKLFNLLNNAYITMKDCLYHKHYKKVADICKLILDTPYVCNDGYIVNLFEIDNLPFDLDDIYKCYIYALIVVGNIKLFPKIEQLLDESNLNIEDVLNVGIKNIDKELFFKHWSNYLDSKYNYSTNKKKKK